MAGVFIFLLARRETDLPPVRIHVIKSAETAAGETKLPRQNGTCPPSPRRNLPLPQQIGRGTKNNIKFTSPSICGGVWLLGRIHTAQAFYTFFNRRVGGKNPGNRRKKRFFRQRIFYTHRRHAGMFI